MDNGNVMAMKLSQLGNMKLAENILRYITPIRGTNAGLHSACAKLEPILYDRFMSFTNGGMREVAGTPEIWARSWNEVRGELAGWRGDMAKVYKKEIDRRIKVYRRGEDAIIRPKAEII